MFTRRATFYDIPSQSEWLELLEHLKDAMDGTSRQLLLEQLADIRGAD